MARHLYDTSEQIGRERAATQLRAIADQIAKGRMDLAYEEYHEPTPVSEPVRMVVDVLQHRHEVELAINIRWSHEGGSHWPQMGGLR